jgi:hypothetical protein
MIHDNVFIYCWGASLGVIFAAFYRSFGGRLDGERIWKEICTSMYLSICFTWNWEGFQYYLTTSYS